MEHFVQDILEYVEQHALERVHLFGYSMGGFAACDLARQHPDRVASVATLGTKFHWSSEVAAREIAMLDAQTISAKVPHFARALARRHSASGWRTVLEYTAGLLDSLATRGGFTPTDAAEVAPPVRVMIGDRDRTVTLAESIETYRALGQGQLEVLPGTPHPLERVSPSRLAYSLLEFFTGVENASH
jgi:pimeloyl-ACP methyl ester carboxylesterase